MLAKLPAIRREIEDRLAKVEDELSLIPEVPLHTAVRTIVDVVHAFSDEVRKEISGEHGYMAWSNAWDDVQQNMWDMLLQLKPTMTTSGKLDKNLYLGTLPGRSAEDSIVIGSDDDTGISGMPETPSKKRKHGVQPKHEGQTPTSPQFRTTKKSASTTRRGQAAGVPSSNQFGDPASFKKLYRLDEVTQYINVHSRSRVPGQIDVKVREESMLSPLKHWQAVTDKFFYELDQRLQQHTRMLFDKHFGHWKGSEIYTESLAIVQSLLDNNIYEQRTTMASESLTDELQGPHIFHKDLFMTEKSATMERYSQARATARLNAYVDDCAAHLGRDLSTAETEKIRKDEKKMSRIREEPYKHEIDLVADITSYYTIAARRFHDSVTMRIESKFFRQLRTRLRDQMQDELGIYEEHKGKL